MFYRWLNDHLVAVTNNSIYNPDQPDDGYGGVEEYIPIAQPTADTLEKLFAIKPSSIVGDRSLRFLSFMERNTLRITLFVAMDALIFAIQAQAEYLGAKKTWTRRLVLITDGQSPIDTSDWDSVVEKMNELNIITTIM